MVSRSEKFRSRHSFGKKKKMEEQPAISRNPPLLLILIFLSLLFLVFLLLCRRCSCPSRSEINFLSFFSFSDRHALLALTHIYLEKFCTRSLSYPLPCFLRCCFQFFFLPSPALKSEYRLLSKIIRFPTESGEENCLISNQIINVSYIFLSIFIYFFQITVIMASFRTFYFLYCACLILAITIYFSLHSETEIGSEFSQQTKINFNLIHKEY